MGDYTVCTPVFWYVGCMSTKRQMRYESSQVWNFAENGLGVGVGGGGGGQLSPAWRLIDINFSLHLSQNPKE